MTTPAHPGRMLFVNLPVAEIERSKAFFAGLGFSFNTQALYCFGVASREEVDTVAAAAQAAGGSEADGAEDYGFMYSRSFFDLDGHGWQVMWMDRAAAQQGPEEVVASAQDSGAPA